MSRLRVLFLCTGNSCRSQMAEGWARSLHPDVIDAYSAGTKPSRVNPLAIEVMRESGVDISGQESRSLEQFLDEPFDYVITLCGDAKETCPVFPRVAQRMHVGFDDPARATGSPEEVLPEFRRVRDEIRAFVAELPGFIAKRNSEGEDV